MGITKCSEYETKGAAGGEQMNKESFKKLKLLLMDRGIYQKDLAKAVRIDKVSLNQKINRNGSTFTLEEASRICDFLSISLDEYFFVENVPKMEQNKTEV